MSQSPSATRTRAKIVARVDRPSAGQGTSETASRLRAGLFELRIDWGPCYRVYYAMTGRICVLLLCGGDKRRQSSDIKRALEYLKDYLERTSTP